MGMTTMESQHDQFEKALLNLDRITVIQMLSELRSTMSPIYSIEGMIVPVLERIGNGWEEGRVSLSQVYMSGRLCEELVDAILPSVDIARKSFPRMAITVLEDFHLLGMRIVYSALRSAGYELKNYGRAEIDQIVSFVKADGIQILLISVLMLPSALRIKNLKEALKAAEYMPKIVVGGAPFRFDEQLWLEVGADGFGRSATEAISEVIRLAGEL